MEHKFDFLFKKQRLSVYQAQYQFKTLYPQPALMIQYEDGSLFAVISCCIPEYIELEEGEILIKSWSENEEVVNFLRETSEKFSDTGRRVPTGHVEAEVWKMNF